MTLDVKSTRALKALYSTVPCFYKTSVQHGVEMKLIA